MLAALYPMFTPEELRASARETGEANLIDILAQRNIRAIAEGIKAQFGGRPRAQERMKRYIKTLLTESLVDDAPSPGRGSDKRLIAVSREVLSAAAHESLMAEMETEFPGWCRSCGTMPGCVGCSACSKSRPGVQTPPL